MPRTVRCRLPKLLRDRGLTLRELHERSGISRQTLSLYKRGNPSRFDPLVVGRLCEVLDIPLSELLVLVEVSEDEI